MKVAELLSRLPHDARGDLGYSIHPAQAQAKAAQMRSLLNADMWEEDKIEAIRKCHARLSNEWQAAVWDFLNASERRAWKEYLILGKTDGRPADPL
jgi:hypothetical protein